MKHCHECHVDVDTTRVTCPLCFQVLEESPSKKAVTEYYPPYQEKTYKNHLVYKIFLFLSIVCAIGTVLINILTFQMAPRYWSAIVVMGVIYLWVLVKGTIISRKNIAFKLLLQALTICVLLYLIEKVSAPTIPWMIPYVMPFIMMATMSAIIIIIFIKTMRYKDYMLYLTMIACIGFFPIVFAIIPVTSKYFNHILWPSIACAAYAAMTILGMFIFGDRMTKDEFRKRFHI